MRLEGRRTCRVSAQVGKMDHLSCPRPFDRQRGTSPICELLRFVGERIPPENELQAFSVWKWEQLPDHSQVMLGRVREQELPVDRVKRLGIKSRPITTWNNLEIGSLASWEPCTEHVRFRQ